MSDVVEIRLYLDPCETPAPELPELARRVVEHLEGETVRRDGVYAVAVIDRVEVIGP
jgi:hypothetical protein